METHGRVIEEQKNYFLVDTDQGIVRCVLKGTLKKVRTRVCAGDLVDLTITNTEQPLLGVISKIDVRTSYIRRPALANLTQILLIATWKSPSIDLEALDRMLFSAEAYGITPLLVFNKIDMLDNEELESLKKVTAIYDRCGYKTILTSAIELIGIDDLKASCTNAISAFTGLSGVGKSTLLSKIFPDITFRIGDVSGAKGRGTHTTTNIILHKYSNGYLADTPGLSFIDIPELPEDSVATCFPEIADCIGQCRFHNCIHNGEPGCKVQEKIDNEEISTTRRSHYIKIFNEMKALRKQYRK